MTAHRCVTVVQFRGEHTPHMQHLCSMTYNDHHECIQHGILLKYLYFTIPLLLPLCGTSAVSVSAPSVNID